MPIGRKLLIGSLAGVPILGLAAAAMANSRRGTSGGVFGGTRDRFQEDALSYDLDQDANAQMNADKYWDQGQMNEAIAASEANAMQATDAAASAFEGQRAYESGLVNSKANELSMLDALQNLRATLPPVGPQSTATLWQPSVEDNGVSPAIWGPPMSGMSPRLPALTPSMDFPNTYSPVIDPPSQWPGYGFDYLYGAGAKPRPW